MWLSRAAALLWSHFVLGDEMSRHAAIGFPFYHRVRYYAVRLSSCRNPPPIARLVSSEKTLSAYYPKSLRTLFLIYGRLCGVAFNIGFAIFPTRDDWVSSCGAFLASRLILGPVLFRHVMIGFPSFDHKVHIVWGGRVLSCVL